MRVAPPVYLAHLTFLKVAPPMLVDLAADTGFAGIGLRLGAARRGDSLFPMVGDSVMRRETVARLRARDMKVLDTEVVCLYPDFAVSEFTPIIDAAFDLGASLLIVNGEDDNEERMADNLAALCSLARPAGLVVALEFMRYRSIRSLMQADRLRRSIAADNIAIVLDTLHAARTDTSPDAIAALPRGAVGLVQLSDAPLAAPVCDPDLREEALGGRLPPGEGALPLKRFLASISSDVPISVEVPTRRSTPTLAHAAAILAGARRLLMG